MMATTKFTPPKLDQPTDVLTEARARVGEILERVENRRTEVLDRRRKALEETLRVAGAPEVRTGLRDKEQLARLDAVAKTAQDRLGRIESDRAVLAESMKKARAAVDPPKKKREGAAGA
jgi:hypothetical protein